MGKCFSKSEDEHVEEATVEQIQAVDNTKHEMVAQALSTFEDSCHRQLQRSASDSAVKKKVVRKLTLSFKNELDDIIANRPRRAQVIPDVIEKALDIPDGGATTDNPTRCSVSDLQELHEIYAKTLEEFRQLFENASSRLDQQVNANQQLEDSNNPRTGSQNGKSNVDSGGNSDALSLSSSGAGALKKTVIKEKLRRGGRTLKSKRREYVTWTRGSSSEGSHVEDNGHVTLRPLPSLQCEQDWKNSVGEYSSSESGTKGTYYL